MCSPQSVATDDMKQLGSRQCRAHKATALARCPVVRHTAQPVAGQLVVVGYLLCPFRQERDDPL